jgi:hypothetical protein
MWYRRGKRRTMALFLRRLKRKPKVSLKNLFLIAPPAGLLGGLKNYIDLDHLLAGRLSVIHKENKKS